jgi:predicted transposase YdaD
MSYDNVCKLLSEKYPESFASWALGIPQSNVKVLKTELSIEPIRADYVTFLKLTGRILHLEFQTQLQSNPPLPLRMLDYWVRLYRLYRLPITQVVVLLLPPPPDTIIETAFILENTRHEYYVKKMWEENPEPFLNEPALLPLAPLAATSQPRTLLQRVVERVNQVEREQQPEISAYTQILAGLKFKKDLIRKIFQEGMMRESVIYQEILSRGEEIGIKLGEQIGEQRERALVVRLLTRRVGELPPQTRARIEALSLEELENLGEALLDFEALFDLEDWLSALE